MVVVVVCSCSLKNVIATVCIFFCLCLACDVSTESGGSTVEDNSIEPHFCNLNAVAAISWVCEHTHTHTRLTALFPGLPR